MLEQRRKFICIKLIRHYILFKNHYPYVMFFSCRKDRLIPSRKGQIIPQIFLN